MSMGDAPTEMDMKPTFHTSSTEEFQVYGCDHYRSNCKILAECCSTWHACRFCHDEWSEKHHDGHTMDRFKVKRMLCLFCKTAGEIGKHCKNCNREMARYFCPKCNLIDDDPKKQIFHCDDCGICRIGRREDYVHCHRCHGCIEASFFQKHRCLEGCLDASCPICGDQLFSSIMPVMFMRCGHAIHSLCYFQHSRESYQCPVCLKSLGDMSDLYRSIDTVLSLSSMPPEYANLKAEILCNDCERRTVTKYHFLYHKCQLCNGYNTKLIKSFAAGEEASMQNAMGVSETDIAGLETVTHQPPARSNSITPPNLDDIEEVDDDDL